MPQFFIDATLEPGREITIRGADARHIAQSLRLTAGDWLVLSDGRGKSFRATITRASAREIAATVGTEIVRRSAAIAPALAIAVIRGERFEWAIQKAVELGCRHLLPFCSARTVRGKADDARKVARWQKIATEAAKQSGLPFLPVVDAPIAFEALCGRIAGFSPAILFFEGEERTSLRSLLRELPRSSPNAGAEPLLIVGPEGGFAAEEVRFAMAAGARSASLGQQILRVETAAVVAMAICQYEIGNLERT